MSTSITDQQITESGASLPEPHFDEEATVLSARPVVPLEEVEALNSKRSLPRPWILGLGLVGALLVGICATVIYYSRANRDDSTSLQEPEVSASIEGNTSESANSFSGPVAPQPAAAVDVPADVKKQARANQGDRVSAAPDKKPRPRLVAVIRENKSNNHGDEESDEDRRTARKQARQERRRAEREKRARRSSDELLRIRDIFEGSPRP